MATTPLHDEETHSPFDPPDPETRAAGMPVLVPEELRAMLVDVVRAPLDTEAAELVDFLTAAEQLKHALEARQAECGSRLRAIREKEARERVRRDQVPTDRALREADRSAAHEVALALHESPHRAGEFLYLAAALPGLPRSAELFRQGLIGREQMGALVQETSLLGAEQRLLVDTELAPVLEDLGVRGTQARTRALAQQLDPEGAVRRTERAAKGRCVWLRPAPNGLVRFGALLPLAEGVGMLRALDRTATAAKAKGDARGRGQLMADALLASVLGSTLPGSTDRSRPGTDDWSGPGVAADRPVPGVEIQLVMTDLSLFGDSDVPALVLGGGTIPAATARGIAVRAARAERAWVRRLYTDPEAGTLVAMESSRRVFPPGMERFVRTRDHGECNEPYCSATIRQIDHVVPVAGGGRTRLDNAQGLCQSGNLVKESPGWRATRLADGSVEVTTPTGTTHRSRPRPLPLEPRRRRAARLRRR